jgi:hypothetical protein
MRKSIAFFFLVAPLLSSVPALASPLHLRESNIHVLASADAGDAARCSLDRQFVLPASSSSWNGDERWTPRGGSVYGDAGAQTLAPHIREPHRHFLPASADGQPNADANVAVNHLFAPPDDVNLFVTQTGNDRPKSARDSNATLAAVQLVIH